MATKENPGKYDCHAAAEPDEPLFTLRGKDRHGPALVRLWALLREKEGEPAEVVAEARQCAATMEQYATDLLKPVLSFEALESFFAVRYREAHPTVMEQPSPNNVAPQPGQLRGDWAVGEPAITVHGKHVGIIEAFVGLSDEDELKLGGKMVNVRFSRDQVATINVKTLRRPTAPEMEAYFTNRR